MENVNTEYKSEIPKKSNHLKAEIVSFLNTEGGIIYLGVDDNGNIIEDKKSKYKEWEELLNNWIFNAFSPSIVELIELKINKGFEIHIKKGNQKPYFYKDGEGFNSKGVYVRIGSSKRLASFEEIQRMIIANKAHEYETLASNIEELTFNYLKEKCNEKNITFDLYGLSLLRKDSKYNNAALLLSDQNPTISKFAVFQGEDVSIFLDKKEFRGSLTKQLDDILYFANLSNKKKIIISGKGQREEYLDIPEKALREAICNCYCHRDWTLSGDIKVEIYDNRSMIFSPGSIPNGLTLENIKNGMTAKRNQIIVSVLDKLEYIENYASGVRRIFKDYESFDKKPEYYISDNGVIVTLYNRNYIKNIDTQKITDIKYENTNDTQNDTQKNRTKTIIDLIKEKPNITIKEICLKLKVSRPTIYRDMKYLKESNILEYQGSSKRGKWVIKK